MISWAVSIVAAACLYPAVSKVLSSRRNFMTFSEARLQAESSMKRYSLHGLLALIRAVLGQVCQSLIVVSNWRPGSPHWCAASQIIPIKSRARYVSTGFPVTTALVVHGRSFSTASMNSSDVRTELFEFWKKIDEYAGPFSEGS